jgi:hypothetical protein
MTAARSFRPPYPLDIAESIADVEHRLEVFLSRSADLSAILSSFARRFGEVAIIGGMVRDFARVGAPGFHSDIDLVIHAPREDVQAFATEIGASSNAFGGNRTVVDGWEIDFWPLKETWACREGHVELDKIEDVLRSTFFDHDAILYHLGRRQVICDADYIAIQRRNIIEINLEPNPSIHGSLYRAARRILGWELSAGQRLGRYIERHLDAQAFEKLTADEIRKQATPIVQRFPDVGALRQALIGRSGSGGAAVTLS